MKKNIFAIVLFAMNGSMLSQTIHSVHLNGGLIIPTSGQVGVATSFVITNQLNSIFSLYL